MFAEEGKMFLDVFIENAIYEDIRDGDHTSQACIPHDAKGEANLLVKQDGVIAGVEVAMHTFRKLDPDIKMDIFIEDSTRVKVGDIVFKVKGKILSILQAERVVLNIMQRMSGIATKTRMFVDKLEGLPTKILDTRKTCPGLRLIEKEAVKIGGGENHRMGLYDMVMIKDNHIDYAGGIKNVLLKTEKYLHERNLNLQIEVEARNIEEIKKILDIGGVNRIMLDNFTPEETKEAVKYINGRVETESSGNIDQTTVRQYAECGVDYISIGALTHQLSSLDLSLKAINT
jgi:nicotinate-nucleotide pyrophosphorylase (carboxylating)